MEEIGYNRSDIKMLQETNKKKKKLSQIQQWAKLKASIKRNSKTRIFLGLIMSCATASNVTIYGGEYSSREKTHIGMSVYMDAIAAAGGMVGIRKGIRN